MADTKISALTALDTFVTGDLLPMVDDPAGTPITKKATIDQIGTFVRAEAATTELAQDAVGAMIDATLVYVDGTPLLTRAALTGDATAAQSSNAITVVKLNGVLLSGLATGILKNTTTTGAPSIAVAGDFPTLNQSTTGNAATATALGAGTDRTKLDGIATAATANSSDATLLARANHTGTQLASTISDFTEASQDVVGALLVDSTGFDVTYNDAGNTFAVALNGLNTVSATGAAADTVGYLGAPQNLGLNSGNVTLALTDNGKHVYHSDANARTLTIPANASVAFPIGTVIVGVNENAAGILTIAITTDTLRWGSSTGSRSVAANGTFSLLKVTSTLWRLTGDGIT